MEEAARIQELTRGVQRVNFLMGGCSWFQFIKDTATVTDIQFTSNQAEPLKDSTLNVKVTYTDGGSVCESGFKKPLGTDDDLMTYILHLAGIYQGEQRFLATKHYDLSLKDFFKT